MMSERHSALLTKSQRQYILGEYEDTNPAHKRNKRKRIRDRVYDGLELDGKILNQMNDELRREIFREWENRNYESHPSEIKIPKSDGERPDQFEKSQFRFGLEGLLEFIYIGVEEGGLGGFEELLQDAIDRAVQEQGLYVENLDIEYGSLSTTKDIYQMLNKGELDYDELTLQEIRKLLDSGLMTPEDFPDGFFDISALSNSTKNTEG